MRRLATFILRLWVDAENCPPSYEGQVEYVVTGEHAHIRSEGEVIHFIRERINPAQGGEARLDAGGSPSQEPLD